MSVTIYAFNNNKKTKSPAGFEYPENVDLGRYEMNLSNMNARAFLSLLDLDDQYLNDAVTLPEAKRAWMKANALFNKNYDEYVRDDEVDGNMVSFGIDKSYLERKLDAFRDLIKAADEAGATHIAWG